MNLFFIESVNLYIVNLSYYGLTYDEATITVIKQNGDFRSYILSKGYLF